MRRRIGIILAVLALPLLMGTGEGESEGGCGAGDSHEAPAGAPTQADCPSGSTLTYETFGRPFVESYCLRCHSTTKTGDDRKGAPAAHDYDLLEVIRHESEHIDQMAGAGPAASNALMPPSAPRPSEAERQKLAEWLACGAK
jgi:hypothetical protein